MKKIYLHIEQYKNEKLFHEEIVEATMDKNFVYFDNFKIKKVDTEKIVIGDTRYEEGKIKRCIKVFAVSKKHDPRFILVQK